MFLNSQREGKLPFVLAKPKWPLALAAGAVAAQGDKPGGAGPARWVRASPAAHITPWFEEMSAFQFPPTSLFSTSNTAELPPQWLCHCANYCQAAQRY